MPLDDIDIETPLAALHRVFGYSSFRGAQQEIVEHVVAGGDAVVLMPTGGGKSLCYQLPALLRPGIGVVVSPLIALMKDQVDALRQAGLRAAALNSSLAYFEVQEIEEAARRGELDLLYVSPERLVMPQCLALLRKCRVALFAVDEAHCISQWGHDFRRDYQALGLLKEAFPETPLMALTATADDPTRRDIALRLHLEDARLFAAGYDRPNIFYRVVAKHTPRDDLLRFLNDEHAGDAGIVYCLTRKAVEDIAQWLSAHGREALPYHAGLPAETRQRNQDRFIREEGLIVVATVAFGMGIDKPNVRFVAHLDAPKNLEAYYQETGRAGRDGLPANAWMSYGIADVMNLRRLIESADIDERQRRIERQKSEALIGFCETVDCRRQALLGYFGEREHPPCGNCDNCRAPVESWDGTVAAQKALSAVYRTGQRFGAHHLVDVLTGNATERIRQLGHDGLKTFGVGTELNGLGWLSVIRQLVAQGHLQPDPEGHGGLMLGDSGADILRGNRDIRFRTEQPRTRGTRRKAAAKSVSGEPLDTAAEALWQALRAWRLEEARRQELPPYVIFHDATLIEVARRRPATLDALADIPGIGRSKLDRYGEALLGVIRET
ncbi:MAG TPA: DNA helicase RecQ [Stellaceae bacterium]|jgi:ATP-dependent DNA helicase RecQ|nr:DNA helicase RecQ [Stellaceae bacterium]